ncbi:MAG: hypothetical protein ACREPG_08990, partial [Candidatus Binatia bacterium]
MASVNLFALNRGEVSSLALARVDQEQLRLAAEQQLNWQPTKIGPMTLRPGLAFIGEINGSQKCQLVEVVYGATDSALIELTPGIASFWVNDALVTRVNSGATVQPFTSWTISSPPTAVVTTSPNLSFSHVTQRQLAYAEGIITVPSLDGTEFGLRITITLGDVIVSIATTSGGEDILTAARFDEGTHSLAIAANNATLYLRIASDSLATRTIAPITIEPVGPLRLPTPYAAGDLGLIRYTQSLDVVYLFRRAVTPLKIERRSTRSFSAVRFKSERGPFAAQEGDKSITMSLGAAVEQAGEVQITASKAVFSSSDVGRLLRIFHNKQQVQAFLNATETYTDNLRISGLKNPSASAGGTTVNGRAVNILTLGTWTGTLTLQKTYDPGGLLDWQDERKFTVNASLSIQDERDNAIAFYRLGFTDNNYTSGSANCALQCDIDGGFGVGEIISYISSTKVLV